MVYEPLTTESHGERMSLVQSKPERPEVVAYNRSDIGYSSGASNSPAKPDSPILLSGPSVRASGQLEGATGGEASYIGKDVEKDVKTSCANQRNLVKERLEMCMLQTKNDGEQFECDDVFDCSISLESQASQLDATQSQNKCSQRVDKGVQNSKLFCRSHSVPFSDEKQQTFDEQFYDFHQTTCNFLFTMSLEILGKRDNLPTCSFNDGTFNKQKLGYSNVQLNKGRRFTESFDHFKRQHSKTLTLSFSTLQRRHSWHSVCDCTKYSVKKVSFECCCSQTFSLNRCRKRVDEMYPTTPNETQSVVSHKTSGTDASVSCALSEIASNTTQTGEQQPQAQVEQMDESPSEKQEDTEIHVQRKLLCLDHIYTLCLNCLKEMARIYNCLPLSSSKCVDLCEGAPCLQLDGNKYNQPSSAFTAEPQHRKTTVENPDAGDDSTELGHLIGLQLPDDCKIGLLKNFAELKRTLCTKDALKIVDCLFQNGHISSEQQVEMEHNLTYRSIRWGLNGLLKGGLVGSNAYLECFIHTMGTFEMFEGEKVYESILKRIIHPEATEKDRDGLMFALSGENVVDNQITSISERFNFHKLRTALGIAESSWHPLADELLSAYKLTLLDHNEICDPNHGKAAKLLLKKVWYCPRLTADDLERFLVASNIEVDGTRISSVGPEVKEVVERRIENNQDIRSAFANRDVVAEHVYKGSIVLELRPLSDEAIDNLIAECQSGKVTDLISYLYDSDEIVQLLGEGEVCLLLKVFLQGGKCFQDNRRILLHLSEPQKGGKGESGLAETTEHACLALDDNMQLLTEELDFRDVFEVLQSHHLLQNPVAIKRELPKLSSRSERTQLILGNVIEKQRCFDVLLKYIQSENLCYVLQNLKMRKFTGEIKFKLQRKAPSLEEGSGKREFETKDGDGSNDSNRLCIGDMAAEKQYRKTNGFFDPLSAAANLELRKPSVRSRADGKYKIDRCQNSPKSGSYDFQKHNRLVCLSLENSLFPFFMPSKEFGMLYGHRGIVFATRRDILKLSFLDQSLSDKTHTDLPTKHEYQSLVATCFDWSFDSSWCMATEHLSGRLQFLRHCSYHSNTEMLRKLVRESQLSYQPLNTNPCNMLWSWNSFRKRTNPGNLVIFSDTSKYLKYTSQTPELPMVYLRMEPHKNLTVSKTLAEHLSKRVKLALQGPLVPENKQILALYVRLLTDIEKCMVESQAKKCVDRYIEENHLAWNSVYFWYVNKTLEIQARTSVLGTLPAIMTYIVHNVYTSCLAALKEVTSHKHKLQLIPKLLVFELYAANTLNYYSPSLSPIEAFADIVSCMDFMQCVHQQKRKGPNQETSATRDLCLILKRIRGFRQKSVALNVLGYYLMIDSKQKTAYQCLRKSVFLSNRGSVTLKRHTKGAPRKGQSNAALWHLAVLINRKNKERTFHFRQAR